MTLKKKNKVERLILPDFKTYKAVVIMTVGYQHRKSKEIMGTERSAPSRPTHVWCKGDSGQIGQSSTSGVRTASYSYAKKTSFHISQDI